MTQKHFTPVVINGKKWRGKFVDAAGDECWCGKIDTNLTPYCDCGLPNEWIPISGMVGANFWGCKKCFHEAMRNSITLAVDNTR